MTYDNRDPLNPASVDPAVPPRPTYDQYGTPRFDPAAEPNSRAPFILLGILVAIGIVGGLLYFNHAPRSSRPQEAQAPISRTLPTPGPTNGPASTASPTMNPSATPTMNSTAPTPPATPPDTGTPSAPAGTPQH
jgi:hypothetical protein